MPLAIELKSITKRFDAFVANENVSLAVEKGRIHAIIGENGAGKTTLMNVLFGLLQPDEGEIWIDGKRMVLANPAAAIPKRQTKMPRRMTLPELVPTTWAMN